jgi:hypothetical protein
MTLAHELGHSMGRPHSQCGSAGLPDIDYPHANGQIGAFGLDVAALRPYGPDTKDLMGYCEDRWIGGYTYERVLEHRLTAETQLRARIPVQPSLVVWGRVERSGLVLEPAYQVDTRPELPAEPGPYTLEGLDASGGTLFSLSFAGREVSEGEGGRVFAYALPLAMARPDRLAALRLSGEGRQVVLRGHAAAPASPPRLRASRAGGRLRVEWDAGTHPLVVLRDPRTREIVSFLRGGAAMVATPERPLEAIASDGIRSVGAGPVR